MLCFLLLFGKKFPWTAKSAREIFQKSARERTLKCPWKRPKKCPWTHPLTREFSPRSAREPKKVPVNIFQKIGFTGTFDVHGKKKTLLRSRKKKNSTGNKKKKQHFHSLTRICPKMVKVKLFRVNKKIWYLRSLLQDLPLLKTRSVPIIPKTLKYVIFLASQTFRFSLFKFFH